VQEADDPKPGPHEAGEPDTPGAPPQAPPAAAALGATAKAEILIEALPYIKRFWGKTVVVKYGGSTLGGSTSLADFANDIVLMRSVGMRPVVVHGGGPQIGELMGRLGKKSEFRDGLRVTDAETLDIARMVLVGKVNRDIVATVNVHGPLAVGVSGEDAGVIQASLRDPALGFVGDIAKVNPELLARLIAENLVPVVATIGSDETGQAYNINADTAASAIAVALEAEKLVFLTDVEGIRGAPADPGSVLSQLSSAQVGQLIANGTVAGGMVPKARAAMAAVAGGVPQATILDGRAPHALLLEIFTNQGIGTMVVP
jgi:acetylglutamate kinase